MVKRMLFTRGSVGLVLVVALLNLGAMRAKTPELVKVLDSDATLFQKARACQQLGEFGGPEAVPALASLLNHDILGVYARTGLERIPGPEAAAALRGGLRHTQGNALIGVIHSVAALRDEEAVTVLAELTEDADVEVAKAALLALGRIATESCVSIVRQALLAGPDTQRPQAAAACLLTAEQELARGNPRVARSLYDAVRQAEVPISYRVGATRGAILARQADRVTFHMRQLRSPDPAIREVALLTIREVPSDALATALNAEVLLAQNGFRVQLLAALKDCHNGQSLQIAAQMVQSEDAGVRLAALRVMEPIGGTASTPTFLEVLRAPCSDLELSVAMNQLEQMADADRPILEALSDATAAAHRVHLIRLLGKRRSTDATDELLRQAAGSDAEVSIAAFQALRPLGGIDDLPQLISLTKQCSQDAVRQAAVSAVYSACRNSDRPDQAGALVLEDLRRCTDATDRKAWIRVLILLGYREALPTIASALRDRDRLLAQDTLTQLARWPDPTPIDLLFGALEGDAGMPLRRRALHSILQLATAAADRKQASEDELVSWFRRASREAHTVQAKHALISGLGRVPHIESLRLLASYLGDESVSTETIHAMVQAADALTTGPDHAEVGSLLLKIPGVEDERLLQQIATLRREVEVTAKRNRR